MNDGRQPGERAVVIGAGIAGTLLGRVLADHFARVTVLERDAGPDADGHRKGAPHAKLVHGILRGGLDAIELLFPGFEAELYAQGAVRCRPARDILVFDSLGEWPRSDVGLEGPLLSRPLLERCLRARLAQRPRVELREQVAVTELIADGERIVGVVCRERDGTVRRELADLVIDASGRGAHTLDWLRQLGFALPEETRVEVDLQYASCFIRPKRAPGLLGMMIGEPPPAGRYGCLVHAQEGGRMIVGIAARGRDTPFAVDSFGDLLARAERLPHPACFELLRDSEPLTPIARYGFPASVHRHYERLERVPAGFLCIGDALCSFNPAWGQGMSVAALQVCALARLLDERALGGADLSTLPGAFYREAAGIIATPWRLSVTPDYQFDSTRGEHKDEARRGLPFSRALSRLAFDDPQIRALSGDVFHLVEPLAAFITPEIVARAQALLSNAPQGA